MANESHYQLAQLLIKIFIVNSKYSGKSVDQTRPGGYKTFFMLNSTELAQLLIKIFIVNSKYSGKSVDQTRPGGYKTFFMLNSTEHEISTAHKH